MFGIEDEAKTITLQDRQRSLTIDLVTEALADATQDQDGAAIDLLTDILVELDMAFPGLGPLTFTFSLDQRVRLIEIFRNEKAEIEDGDVLYTDPQLTRETLDELVELLNTPAGE